MNKIGSDWKNWYNALRAAHPDVYEKAIRYSEAQCINHRIPTQPAADIERSYVMFACELLDVNPYSASQNAGGK